LHVTIASVAFAIAVAVAPWISSCFRAMLLLLLVVLLLASFLQHCSIRSQDSGLLASSFAYAATAYVVCFHLAFCCHSLFIFPLQDPSPHPRVPPQIAFNSFSAITPGHMEAGRKLGGNYSLPCHPSTH